MRMRFVLAAALAVSVAALGGCGKEKLTEVQVPDSGVAMTYDLTAGQSYGGHIKMRNSVQTPMGDMVQSIEFDVDLVVQGDVGGTSLVSATVSEIDLTVRLPDGMPQAMAGGFNAENAKALNGMNVRFKLGPDGELDDMPEPPENAAPEVRGIIAMVSGALSGGFVRLPPKALKEGETWDLSRERQDDDGSTRSTTGTGTFNGLARNDAGEEVAKLAYESEAQSEAETQAGRMQSTSKAQIEALFSTSGGYPSKVERTVNAEIKGLGGMLSEIDAEWKKLDKRAVDPIAPEPDQQVEEQQITDPCDPDYVGGEECVDDAAPADDAAAPEAPAEAPAESPAS